MGFAVTTFLIALSLCIGLAVSIEIGYKLGKHELTKYPESKSEGLGVVDSAVFGILGLILAFTFTGALSRFDQRRELALKEANAIGTAYLRLDLLPTNTQEKLRPLYKEYVQARVDLYANYEQEELAKAKYNQSLKLQTQIWETAKTSVLVEKNPGIMSLVLSSTNDMIDVTNERLQASRTHPPNVVYFFLFIIAIISSLLVGYGMSTRDRRYLQHTIAFCVVISTTVYVILDLEYPRRALFQISAGDQVLIEVLESMK